MCKLSIITINRNNVHGLQKTIESVVSQTFTDVEFIIIDGASTDGSVDVIQQYIDNITYWVSEPDSGIYNAMNKGIQKATGEYLLFLNSGDWLYNSNTLQELFSNSFNEDIVYCNRKSVENFEVIGETIFPEKLTFQKFFHSTIGHQSTIIKRQLFETVGDYNESNKYASDWEFFLLAFATYNATYRHIPIFLCYFDVTGLSSISENLIEMNEERKKILLQHYPFFYDDYVKLFREEEYHKMIRNRNSLRRIKDFMLYLIKSPNFDR